MTVFSKRQTVFQTIFALFFLVVFSQMAFSQTTFKIMPLGDSITRGVFGGTDNAGYRNDLQDSLDVEGVLYDFVGSLSDGNGTFDKNHEGHDGFRADQILANINLYLGANPDIVLLHIGTNDDFTNPDSITGTRDEISQIIDAIAANDPTTLIILASLIPRTDAEDAGTTSLNNLLVDLYQTKQGEGKNVFYAPMNEIFKSNPNWATDYFNVGDNVHPNDFGYSIMAGVWLKAIMTAINIGADITVTDNFERSQIGLTWAEDPNIILQNGDLIDNSPSTVSPSTWKEMAVYKGLKNPSSVSLKWSALADAAGIGEGGLALLLDSPSETANGYLAWITTGDNMIRLWTIANGESATDLNQEKASQTTVPGPGDVFRVDVTVDPSNLQFDYYVNDVFAGNITIANPGVSGELYSGVLLRHNRNNQIDEFTVKRAADITPPDAITNLQSTSTTATSVSLSWSAPGDDGAVGQASSYDVRYSTSVIDASNFDLATAASGEPSPSPAGSIENFTATGLSAGTTYYFAVKTSDEAGNTSTISNVISATTISGNIFVDNFDRTSLGANWTADADYAIVNNELANTSAGGVWNEIAVLNARKKPVEVSYQYAAAPDADATGIDQSGFVIVFGAASELSSGYAITRRTGANNEIRLWNLVNGALTTVIEKETAPNLSPPNPGDEVKIVISSDVNGNHFDYFINGVADGRVSDPAATFDLTQDYWAGVALNGGFNNNIDNFTELQEIGPPSVFEIVAGDAQTDTVGQTAPIPLTVRITDDGGAPIQGANVGFTVLTGGGSVDVPPLISEIVIESEFASFTAPMQEGTDVDASNGKFISVPVGTGGSGTGAADITFNVSDPGDYIIWGRAIYPDNNSNSFFVSMDGGAEVLWDIGQFAEHSTTWKWDEVSDRGSQPFGSVETDPVIWTLGAGSHTLRFREGKEGTKLDQIVLTKVGSGFSPPVDESPVQAGGTLTDAAGEAKTNFTLGTVAGTQMVQAEFNGFTPLVFNITARSDAPATITKLSGDNQTAPRGTQLPLPFVVEIRDQFNNLYTSSPTNWTVIRGDGTLDNPTPDTDINGQAQATMTISADSAFNVVKVSAPGYTGPDVTFTAIAEAGNPTTMAIAGGDNQTGTASQDLANTIDVLVTDDIGTPVPNHSVTFTVTNGGGAVNGGTQAVVQTNGVGVASVTWTLGPAAAAINEVQASATFNGTPLTNSPLTFTAISADPAQLEAVSSLTQNGIAGVPLADSITVRVRDALGQPLAQYPVTFTVTLGGGRVNTSTNPVEVTTDANGLAKVEWTLGPMAGSSNNKLRASATFNNNDLTGSPIEFTASAQIGDADALQLVSGNNQTGQVLTTLAEPFVVRVTDATNNPIQNWPVTFTVVAGGGNFSGNSSVVVNTGADGLASASYTLGSEAGTVGNEFNNLVEASAENNATPLNGSPVVFKASAVATAATTLELVSGGGQSGQAGEPLPQPIVVKVTDAQGNGIGGHSVHFETGTNSGTIDGATLTSKEVNTNASGEASVSWYLGGDISNTQSLVVSATDGINNLANSPLTVQANASTGPVSPDSSLVLSDRESLPADGTTKANITVRLTDRFGNPVAGKTVIITSTGSNNDITQPLNPTNAMGEAFGTISSTTAELKQVSARVVSDGLDLNSFVSVQFTSQAAERMQRNAGNNQTANVGTAAPIPISVKVLDMNNNGVAGVDVNFNVTSGGGYLLGEGQLPQGALGKVQTKFSTDAQGVASAYWVLGPQPGSNTAEASVDGLLGSPVQFSATGESAVATTIVLVSGDLQPGIRAGDQLPEALKVKVVDSNGKPVAGVDVLFEVQQGGGTFTANGQDNITLSTDPFGLAQVHFRLGPTVGTNVVHAINAALAGSPVPFTFESVIGPPAILSINSGDGTSAPVQSLVPISIKVTDVNGNAVEGVSASFQVIEGEASVESADALTDAVGIADAQIRLPNTIGTVKVKATSDRLPGFYKIFTLTVLPGSATNIMMVSANNLEGTVGKELVGSLVVKVTDTFGNPVPDFQVQWIVTKGGGSLLLGQTTQTDSAGLAENRLQLGPTVGTNEVWAITSGLVGSPVVFTATGVTNNFPVFVGLNDTVATEGTLLNIQLVANDADNDPITYSAPSIPPGAVFNATTALFSWNPADGQAGTHQATFRAADNKGGFDEKTITITVRNSNNVPVVTDFSPQDLNVIFTHGEVITFSVTATDADNDNLTYEWRIFADNDNVGTLLSTSASFQLETTNFLTGTYRIEVRISDGMDTVSMEWNSVDIVSSVELSSFVAQFTGFDGVKISWTTSREIDNTGFNVLRSNTPNGTFAKINEKLIASNSKGEYAFVDKNVEVGMRYFYKLEDVDINGVKTQHDAVSLQVTAPETFELSQNYPNPFNPETKIRFQLPKSTRVVVRIFDVLGRQVRTLIDAEKPAGFHILTWDAKNELGMPVSSGIYYYQIIAGEFKETRKMLLMK